jgi:murein L,D-transpeptidase YcbB/YkuD
MSRTIIPLFIILFLALVSNSQPLTVQQIIKNKINAGGETGSISADGIILYAQDVLSNYYELNEYIPAWKNKKNFKEVISILQDSYNEGLLPDDYHMSNINRLLEEIKTNPDPSKLADLDLLITDGLLLYGSNLIMGKVDQSKIRPGWDVPPNELPGNGDSLLYKALEHKDLTRTINSIKPDNFMYTHLRKGLKHYREIAKNGGWPKIPDGEVLKPGMKDERVMLIRDYLKIVGDLPADALISNGNIYDSTTIEAVKKFQFRHNLNQDGVIGKGTLRAMNVSVEQRIAEIRVNMERARWVIHHLPEDFLVVNIAGFNIRRLRHDSIIYYSRVIVGKHYHESPIFRGTLRYIILNPTWTLTYSIATKETLPKLKKDPGYLEKKNMIIMDRSGKILDPSTIDFNKLSAGNFPYTIQQKAGPHNSLGEVKFMFPNKYSVYLHDTPARSLFANEERAFSHGCIRLQKKWELFLSLVDDPQWNMDRINEVIASEKTTRVNLKNPIEIILLYWTAGADRDDKLYFNKDIYDRDSAVLSALDKPVVFKKAR